MASRWLCWPLPFALPRKLVEELKFDDKEVLKLSTKIGLRGQGDSVPYTNHGCTGRYLVKKSERGEGWFTVNVSTKRANVRDVLRIVG